MLTKIQILNAVVENVKKQGGPSIDMYGDCYYLHPDKKKMCAVGMFMLNPGGVKYRRSVTTISLNKEGKEMRPDKSYEFREFPERMEQLSLEYSIDPLLREEARGHNLEFWLLLQRFHDAPMHWHKHTHELTERGRIMYGLLSFKWK